MKIYLLPLLFAFTAPVNADDFSEQLSNYLQATANTRWSQSREVVVQNLAAVDDTLVVVVPVTGGPEMAYVVVDESSRPIVTQSDDLDGDGTVDKVCSLLKLRANEQRMVVLLSAEADLPPCPVGSDPQTSNRRLLGTGSHAADQQPGQYPDVVLSISRQRGPRP